MDKITAIILKAVANHEAKSVENKEGEAKISDSEESILEEVNNN